MKLVFLWTRELWELKSIILRSTLPKRNQANGHSCGRQQISNESVCTPPISLTLKLPSVSFLSSFEGQDCGLSLSHTHNSWLLSLNLLPYLGIVNGCSPLRAGIMFLPTVRAPSTLSGARDPTCWLDTTSSPWLLCCYVSSSWNWLAMTLTGLSR